MDSGIKSRSRKDVTLPSGATVFVRALTTYDQILILGDLPSSIKVAEDSEESKERIREFFSRTTTESYRVTRLLYLRAVTSERFVDKHPADCGDGETSIYEVSDEDFLKIQQAVDSMRRIPKEDAELARPFPEKNLPGGGDSLPREGVRETPDGDYAA